MDGGGPWGEDRRIRPSRWCIPPREAPSADVAGQRRSVASLQITPRAAAVLNAALPSALVKAANMEPVMFMSIASTDWGVAATMLRSSVSTSSIDRSLTRTPAPVIILARSKCWTPSR